MKLLVLLSLVSLVVGEEGNSRYFFYCNDRDLAIQSQGEAPLPTEIFNSKEYEIALDEHVNSYTPKQQLKVTLRPSKIPAEGSGQMIREFVMVAREVCVEVDCVEEQEHKPIGTWLSQSHQVVTASCTDNDNGLKNIAFQADGRRDKGEIILLWEAPEVRQEIEFCASLYTSEDVAYIHICSKHLTRTTQHGEGEAYNPHEDQREQEQPNNDDEEYEEELAERDGEEREEPGPFEDPHEGEREEAERYRETMERDMAGSQVDEDDDHGARLEEEMKLAAEERRRQMIEIEDLESEQGYLREQYEEARAREEEYQREIMEYEKDMEEEEKRHRQIMEWEIRDKKEHDRLMEEMERERASKKDKEEKENVIDVEEVVVVQEEHVSAGNHVTGSLFVVLTAAILKLFL